MQLLPYLGKLYLEIKTGYCRLDTFKCAMKSGEKANPLPKCPWPPLYWLCQAALSVPIHQHPQCTVVDIRGFVKITCTKSQHSDSLIQSWMKQMQKLTPPLPSFQWWKQWQLLVVARVHHWFAGRGGLISYFILFKIVGSNSSRTHNPSPTVPTVQT